MAEPNADGKKYLVLKPTTREIFDRCHTQIEEDLGVSIGIDDALKKICEKGFPQLVDTDAA